MSHIDQGGPPEKEVRAPHHQDPASYVEGHTTTNTDSITASGRQVVFDVLAGLRRRREHVVRSEGGDPEHPTNDRGFHRPTVGIGAYHLRDGHRRGVTYAARELWLHLSDEGRARAVELVAAADQEVDQ